MPSRGGNKPATQADVQAVQSGLKRHITAVRSELKGDIAAVRLELKGDIARLDKKIGGVALELVKTREEMATKADIAGINKQLDRIIGALDSFAGETADNKRSLVVQGDMLGKHRQRLDGHEARISALEAKP